MTKRTWFYILGVVALAVALLSYFVPKKEKTPVRVVVLSNITPTLPHWVAQERGYYADEGLEPKEYSFTSSSEPVSAMANGDADFLPGVAMLDIMIGVSKGRLQPVLISHCRVTRARSFESLIVPYASPISNVKDLEGKIIAVNPGPSSVVLL